MRHREHWSVLLALGFTVLAPSAAQAAPTSGLWAGVSGGARVSFVISRGRLTELVVSCDSAPSPLDTARRYRIASGGKLSPSKGGPPLRGRLGTRTGGLTLTSPPAACAFAKRGPLKVNAMPPPRVRDGIYHATGPVVAGNGGLDIRFRIDGGGGVVRDIHGHVDSIIPPPPPSSGSPTPCTASYDGLADRAMTLEERPNSTELRFYSVGRSGGLPSIQAATSTNILGAPDVPAGQFRGTVLHGNVPGCAPGGGLLVANLEVPEVAATEPIPGFGSAFPGPPVGRPGCLSTADAPPVKAIAACFTREGRGRPQLFVSTGRVRANGIDITPTSGGEVVLDPAGPSITSRGSVDVRVGRVLLYRGELSRKIALRRSSILDVRIGRDYSIDDNKIGGLPITGSAKLTLDPEGSTDGEVTVTLPKPFAGTNATVSFRATNKDGLVLDGAMLEVDAIDLLPHVVELTDMSFGFTRVGAATHWDGAGMVYLPILTGSRCAKLPVVKGIDLNHQPFRLKDFFKHPERLLLKTGLGLTAGFGIGDDYRRLGVSVDGLNCYLAYGVFLQRLAVEGGVDPLTVMMGAGFSLGPQLRLPIVGKLEAASLDGTSRLTLDSHEELTTEWTGRLKLGLSSFEGSLKLSPAGADLTAKGEYSIVPGVLRTRATMAGWVDKDAFNLDGTGDLLVPGPDQKSDTVISSEGAAGCRTGFGPKVGWGYRWGERTITWFSHSCGIGAYRVARSARAAQAGGGSSFQIPRGERVATFAAVGTDQPPVVRLTGPDIDVTTNPASVTSTARVFTLPDAASHTTYLAVERPRPGRFTVTSVAGSPALAQVLGAQSLPRVGVRARLRGRGARRLLIYRATGLRGGTLVFSERGGGRRRLATTDRRRGSVSFLPGPGRGERRTIVVTVLRDGVPEPARTIASYRAPRTPRARKPRKLRVRRTREGRLVSWVGPREARYVVAARLSDGRRLRWEVSSRRLAINPLGPATRVRVTVQQLDVVGRPGRAATSRG